MSSLAAYAIEERLSRVHAILEELLSETGSLSDEVTELAEEAEELIGEACLILRQGHGDWDERPCCLKARSIG